VRGIVERTVRGDRRGRRRRLSDQLRGVTGAALLVVEGQGALDHLAHQLVAVLVDDMSEYVWWNDRASHGFTFAWRM
jgi:glucose-6-phosphate dehydrogenase assembly protein OpcA